MKNTNFHDAYESLRWEGRKRESNLILLCLCVVIKLLSSAYNLSVLRFVLLSDKESNAALNKLIVMTKVELLRQMKPCFRLVIY